MDFTASERERFNFWHGQMRHMVYEDTECCRSQIEAVLDQLSSLNYSAKLVPEPVAADLMVVCCRLVPLRHDKLVGKVCKLIYQLGSWQQLVIVSYLGELMEYVVSALASSDHQIFPDILTALGTLVYENCSKVSCFHERLVGKHGLLPRLIMSSEENIFRGAVQCIENLCLKNESDGVYLTEELQESCLVTMLTVLRTIESRKMDDVVRCKVLCMALRGTQNVVMATKNLPSDLLGQYLAVLKHYIFYGVTGQRTDIPESLYPTPLSQYDPVAGASKSDSHKQANADKPQKQSGAKGQNASESGKKSKKKKSRGKKAATEETEEGISLDTGGAEAEGTVGFWSGDHDGTALFSTRGRMISSESEFSDTEGGTLSRLRAHQGRVRQQALGTLHAVVKVSEKRIMFGFWSSFIPDTLQMGGAPQGQTLFTVIMKDTSPKVRTSAVYVLTLLLDGSKAFLAAADDSEAHRAAFTPFSTTIASTIKELHRCLLLAMSSENSPLATMQIVKCLGVLVMNCPYQKLRPGLLSRIVKQVKPLMNHRDPKVRVACLTCMGAVVQVQAPLLEVCHLLQPNKQRGMSVSTDTPAHPGGHLQEPESGYQSRGSVGPGGSSDSSTGGQQDGGSGQATPGSLSSGSLTPSAADGSTNQQTSWLVKHCLKNVAPFLLEGNAEQVTNGENRKGIDNSQPLPVRLESLQVLAGLAKGYFPILSPNLKHVRDLICLCIEDSDTAVKIHGLRLLQEMASIMLYQIKDTLEPPPPALQNLQQVVDTKQVLDFWITILTKSLPNAIQNDGINPLKSISCDCLSNIGSKIFQMLPMKLQMLCITLLLGMMNDDHGSVRSAAVRAIGCFVLYSCLRDDVSFMADAANSIINALEDSFLVVRTNASWSLGNLTGALCANKENKNEEFIQDFSDMLLLKLLTTATRAAQDNDKVRPNATRAIGNLLCYIPERSYGKSSFDDAVNKAVQALIRNISTGPVKVRWNACYAAGSLFRNHLLPVGSAPWTETLHQVLCSTIKECKNFKVRINAALAFSVPEERQCYGDTGLYTHIISSLIQGLEASETVTDFAEFRYRNNLLNQVVSSLVHMLGLLGESDLPALAPLVQTKEDKLQDYVDRYVKLGADSEQKDTSFRSLTAATEHIRGLLSSPSLDEEGAIVLQLLLEILSKPAPKQISPVKTAFKQTYD